MSTPNPLPVTDVTACCAPISRDELDPEQADDLARVLKAIAEPNRLRIISIIARTDEREACVCDINDALDHLGQPTISHHLKVLTDAGFLSRTRRGSWAYYRLVPGSLEALTRVLVTA